MYKTANGKILYQVVYETKEKNTDGNWAPLDSRHEELKNIVPRLDRYTLDYANLHFRARIVDTAISKKTYLYSTISY